MAASTDHQQLSSGIIRTYEQSASHMKNANGGDGDDNDKKKKKLFNSAGLDSQILCRVVHRCLSVNE